jgi:hypothetical protein
VHPDPRLLNILHQDSWTCGTAVGRHPSLQPFDMHLSGLQRRVSLLLGIRVRNLSTSVTAIRGLRRRPYLDALPRARAISGPGRTAAILDFARCPVSTRVSAACRCASPGRLDIWRHRSWTSIAGVFMMPRRDGTARSAISAGNSSSHPEPPRARLSRTNHRLHFPE